MYFVGSCLVVFVENISSSLEDHPNYLQAMETYIYIHYIYRLCIYIIYIYIYLNIFEYIYIFYIF